MPLPVGARLGAFDVRALIGRGTYGLVYRVWDPETEAEYAIKEYLPAMLAVRDGEHAVAPRSPDDAEAFALGLRLFVDEGKLLSQLRHPSLVHVYGAWEENGTAYMAMNLVAGRNLHDTLLARWKSPREATLRAMLDSLLGALDVLHRAGLQHRDIAPQSIVIGPTGRPLLMDLGAPRRLRRGRDVRQRRRPRARALDRPLCPGRHAALHDHRQAAGAVARAGGCRRAGVGPGGGTAPLAGLSGAGRMDAVAAAAGPAAERGRRA